MPGRPATTADHMDMQFIGEMWYWRGPAPYYFVTVPEEQSADLHAVSREVTYGWGMIPVRVQVGSAVWETSLWPKDGGYVVPIKDLVRDAEDIDDGDVVSVRLTVLRKR